jgi:hypothetical protein
MNTWNANKIVMAELQRERGTTSGAPEYLHQDKSTAGQQQQLEDSEKASV